MNTDNYLSAPMSFLSNTDTGSLINRLVSHYIASQWSFKSNQMFRFSQDLRLVDVVLPMALSIFLFGKQQTSLVKKML